ncbi:MULTISPECIES: hypothetical protein [unclassified Helicobacter]|uniref:hypothetical protein n=1 Tax=unclassified Helicobacter TaxID=2593540 RepID=UPI000CF0834D|nr:MULTISPECIES: hypothetical protein [unclassified Helicobacter]
MRINQVVELLQGELSNSPAIGSFNGIALSLNSLKKGSLFFAKCLEEIDMAIAMGAYGIVYDKFVQMIDAEIAWIKVQDMQESIARLVRYYLLNKNIEVFYLKPREFEIFLQVCTDDGILCFDGNLEKLLEKISQDTSYKGVVVSDHSFLNLALEYTKSIVPQEKVLEIHIATLFDMKVYYKLSQYYLLLPALFFNELSAVVHLCQTYQIDFNLGLFKSLPSVLPSFVDSTPKLLDYGASERVVIAQKSLIDFSNYANYILQNGRWGRIVGFFPKDCDVSFDFEMAYYENQEELLELIGKKRYNFALVLGIENQDLAQILNRPVIEPMATLF